MRCDRSPCSVARSLGSLYFQLHFRLYQNPMCVTVLPYIVNESILMHLKAKAPNVAIEKFEDLENCLKGMIEQHVESVPPVGSREKLSADILSGMTATWHLVSPQFHSSRFH